MTPEASEKPRVKLEALFCFSDECYAIFVCLCSVPVPKASFFSFKQSKHTNDLPILQSWHLYVTDEVFVWRAR